MTQKNEYGCSLAAPTARSGKASAPIAKRRLTIEFMYLDRTACAPCRLTETNLEAALLEATGLLNALNVEVTLRKIHIQSLEQALALGFALSPTLRLNGVDIQPDGQAGPCVTCGEISGTATECRVWRYQGQAYDAPPKAMLVEALLAAARKPSENPAASAAVSDRNRANLKRFFDARPELTAGLERGEARITTNACCAPAMASDAACCKPPSNACRDGARS